MDMTEEEKEVREPSEPAMVLEAICTLYFDRGFYISLGHLTKQDGIHSAR